MSHTTDPDPVPDDDDTINDTLDSSTNATPPETPLAPDDGTTAPARPAPRSLGDGSGIKK